MLRSAAFAFQSRSVYSHRLAIDQPRFGKPLRNPGEHRSMRFNIDQPACSRNRRMIRGRLVQFQSQKRTHAQRVCRAPSNCLVPIRFVRRIPASAVENSVPAPDSDVPSWSHKTLHTLLPHTRQTRSYPTHDSVLRKKGATRSSADLVSQSTSIAGEVSVYVLPMAMRATLNENGQFSQ